MMFRSAQLAVSSPSGQNLIGGNSMSHRTAYYQFLSEISVPYVTIPLSGE
jgi:hypothetical protein